MTASETVYRYPDENDVTLYEVVRNFPKRFVQRVSLGSGLYDYKLNCARRVPFRLPELRAAIEAGRTIFVVEGEKDVDALHGVGLCATTNAQGAGWKWTPGFVESFKGAKRVVFIVDSDAPGRKAAADRAPLVAELVGDVRILDLAPDRDDGFDVSDWLAAGHDTAELKAIVALAKPIASPDGGESEERIARLVSTSAIRPVETEYVVAPYVPRGEATWFEGTTKSGKTMVALDVAARVSNGTAFITGVPIERANVAILTCEDDPARTIVPRLIAAGADLARVSILGVERNGEECVPSFVTDLPTIEKALRAADVALVIVDGTFGMLGVSDSNSYTNAYASMVPFISMVRALDIGAIIIRHVRKTDASALHRGIGSVGFGALARSTISIAVDRDDETGARRLFAHAGSNVGETGATYAFRIEGVAIPEFERTVGRLVWDGIVDVNADDAMANRTAEDGTERDVAEEFLRGALGGPMPASEVYEAADKLKINRRTLRRAAKRCGVIIERRGFGQGSIWSPPPEAPDSIRDTEPYIYLSRMTPMCPEWTIPRKLPNRMLARSLAPKRVRRAEHGLPIVGRTTYDGVGVYRPPHRARRHVLRQWRPPTRQRSRPRGDAQ